MPNPTALSSDLATLNSLNVDLKKKSEELKQAIYSTTQQLNVKKALLKQKTESAITLKRETDIIKRNNKLEVDCNASPDINLDDLFANNEALKASYVSLQQELQLLHDQHAEALEGLQNNQKLLEELTENNLVQNSKIHCTACNVHLGSAMIGANNRFVHLLLKVLICKNCYHFNTSGEFKKDEDGSELYCR
ncbi:hypothetical protein HUJ05_001509 [Dendroctonus ponderosae]|nr:hypothetical protein HUJ05_001509 [Dendroctonus ponderosae]